MPGKGHLRAFKAVGPPCVPKQKMTILRGKRGIARIIEAAIAALILLGFLIFIQGQQLPKLQYSTSVYKIQHQILVEIENNQTLRSAIVLSNDPLPVNLYISERLANYPLEFSSRICAVEEVCACISCPQRMEIYADSIVIGTNISDYNPKKLSLYFWFGGRTGVTPPAQPPPTPPSPGGCTSGDTRSCYTGSAGTSGIGICKAGTQTCTAGTWSSSCSGEVLPSTEVCNGLDDDCNGIANDGLTAPLCAKQQGVCLGSKQICGGVSGWTACTDATYSAYSSYYATTETGALLCSDLKDNNCNGLTDLSEPGC